MPGCGGGWPSWATSQAAAFLIKPDPSLGHFVPFLVINELNVQCKKSHKERSVEVEGERNW